MLSQPLSRTRILLSGMQVSVIIIKCIFYRRGSPGFVIFFDETGMAIIHREPADANLTSLLFGVGESKDKARGIGAALLLWFYFALIYDGIVLLILFTFSDYPLEKLTLLLSALNPIDLGRIFIMLKMDISALMGYTGALYEDFW
jgi:Cu-processing system permease protein